MRLDIRKIFAIRVEIINPFLITYVFHKNDELQKDKTDQKLSVEMQLFAEVEYCIFSQVLE